MKIFPLVRLYYQKFQNSKKNVSYSFVLGNKIHKKMIRNYIQIIY